MSKKQKITHPSWALDCKRKGTELRNFKGNYYLYEILRKPEMAKWVETMLECHYKQAS